MTLKPRSRIFQLARRDAEIEQRSADADDAEFVEHLRRRRGNSPCRSVTRPPYGREPLAGVLDRVGILIEGQNIGAGPQNLLGMSAAAAGGVDDQRAGARREQLDRFRARAPDDDK